MEARTCVGCGSSDETVVLEKCRMCFRFFCADCAHKVRGAQFCSDACGQFYMHGDDDDRQEMMREDYGDSEEDWPI
ncbi:MAG: hypothetical protein R3338_06660 [Thermoanaerobaculia bacterium]|nr:hypothetical protein [Thermoanaerobaculia bacterium]